MHQKYFSALPALTVVAGLALPASAATISETFEGEPTDGSAPSGWTLINGTSGTYSTTAGTGNPGQSGNFDWTGSNTTPPSVYLVNSGPAYDLTQSITGTFDFYVVEDGNYSYGNFIFGDVQDGLTNTSSGEFLNVALFEKTFGTRARIYNGANGLEFSGDGNNLYEIFTNQWNSATFTWTPTSGTTGDFSFSWTRPGGSEGPMTVTGFTFDSAEAYFGFGTGDSPMRFDNISITGTELVDSPIPEPASLALVGFGGLLVSGGRRRR